jgi:hypothetical protein
MYSMYHMMHMILIFNYIFFSINSVGTAPGLLWTIFVGATFGSVNKRGVDGNKEFDQNSVRKGVVLGLGIGLGIMGLIGTGIYARRELIKIVIAEQRERAIEEMGEEMSQQLVNNPELRAIEEDGSASFEDLENPQLGDGLEIDFSLHSDNSNTNTNSERQSRSPLPGRMQRRPWTPETVANELPILPKLKLIHRFISPEPLRDNQLATEKMENSETSAVQVELVGSTHNSRHSSMPPLRDDLSLDLEEGITSYNAVASSSPPLSPNRRATLQHSPSPENIEAALSAVDEMKISHDNTTFLTPVRTRFIRVRTKGSKTGNRQRSNTDPSPWFGSASYSKDEGTKGSRSTTPLQRKKRWTPKTGLRKRNSSESLVYQEESSKTSMDRSPNKTSQQEIGETSISRSLSLPDLDPHGQLPDGRQRSSSYNLPFETCDGNLVLDINPNGASDDEGEPNREWFWLWA